MVKIEIEKELEGFQLQITLELAPGEIVGIVGESGSGKTTLLRLIAGLERGEGRIEVGGEIWQDSRHFLPPQRRKVGFLFQEYALFPNMKVIDNLLYVSKDRELAYHLLQISDLLPYRNRYPSQLSGGQKQRVALCRALMGRPRLLLLDEPLSALHPELREKLQQEILKLHREFNLTTLLVSHHPAELYRLTDRVVQLHRGKVVKVGKPWEILPRRRGLIVKGVILEMQPGEMVVDIDGELYQVPFVPNKNFPLSPGEVVELQLFPQLLEREKGNKSKG
jgi:molybdate transport system ATP-binding protein